MGVSNTMIFFQKESLDRPLKESTVRTWKNKYWEELKSRLKLGKLVQIEKLESARRGHPLLLGSKIDKEVEEYVKSLREAGDAVNSAIVRGVAEGIIEKYDSNLLECNGGHISITKTWAKIFCIAWASLNEDKNGITLFISDLNISTCCSIPFGHMMVFPSDNTFQQHALQVISSILTSEVEHPSTKNPDSLDNKVLMDDGKGGI